VVVDGNGVVVVPRHESAAVLEKAKRLMETESVVQEKIRAGATIGQLIEVDEVFRNAFSYQDRAAKRSD
jgi:regulator of RNase E activity RraA